MSRKAKQNLPGFWIQRDRDEQLTLLVQKHQDSVSSERPSPFPRLAKDYIAYDSVVFALHEFLKGPLLFQHRLYNTKKNIQAREERFKRN